MKRRLRDCVKAELSLFYLVLPNTRYETSFLQRNYFYGSINDKAIASPNVSPGRYNLKLQVNKMNFENCSAQQYFKNPYRNPFQSSSLLAIRTSLCICSVIEIFLHCFERLFLYFNELDGHFPCLNLAKIRDTVPLKFEDKEQGNDNYCHHYNILVVIVIILVVIVIILDDIIIINNIMIIVIIISMSSLSSLSSSYCCSHQHYHHYRHHLSIITSSSLLMMMMMIMIILMMMMLNIENNVCNDDDDRIHAHGIMKTMTLTLKGMVKALTEHTAITRQWLRHTAIQLSSHYFEGWSSGWNETYITCCNWLKEFHHD